MSAIKLYYFALILSIGILSFLIHRVKKKQREEQYKRRKLASAAEKLVEIQLHMLHAREWEEEESFLFWLTKDIHHYLIGYMVQAKLDSEGKLWLDWYVISKYPQLFAIFDEPDKKNRKQIYSNESREHFLDGEVQQWQKKNGTFQKAYDIWRLMAENEHWPWFYTDCTVEEARDRFSAICHLKERIPFMVMLRYEQKFDAVRSGTGNIESR